MKGEGFKALKKQGDKVKAGDRIVTFDVALCKEKAKSLISPVVVTNMERVVSMSGVATGDVAAGKNTLFEVELKM